MFRLWGVEDKTLLFAVHRGGALRRGVEQGWLGSGGLEQGWLGSGGFFSVSCGSVSWVLGEFVSQFGGVSDPFSLPELSPLIFSKKRESMNAIV